jgi:response regulator RpfG family c-di-GMP phosphodiesterase
MPQILIIEADKDLGPILKLNAQKTLNAEVIEKKSANEAISFIQILPGLDLIICREKLPGSFEVIKTLVDEGHVMSLIWIGKLKPDYPFTYMLPKEASWEDIIKEAAKVLEIKTDNESVDTEGFLPVDCHYLLNVSSENLGCDVYIKMKKEGNDHYVKCLHATDSFTRSDIEKYINSGLKEFHVPKSHFNQFVTFVTNQLVGRLHEQNLEGVDRIAMTGEAYKISMERIQSLGLDEHAVSVAEASIKSMETSIAENNALGSFLKLMRVSDLSYAYANAYLLSLILHKVSIKFEWCTNAVKEKLTYIAYFHNCSLKDEKLMMIQNQDQLNLAELTNYQRDQVVNHAHLSAAIVDKSPTVPDGVGTIIKEHHGAKNGVGFPSVLSSSISPISMMFIVVEDFVDHFLEVSEKPTKSDFARIRSELESKYKTQTYLLTFNALDELIFRPNLST